MSNSTANSIGFTVLLVDDRPENNILLKEVLENENRHFITASSGNEALKIVLKNPHIGLVLLDVQMPDMDGFEVARILKSNSKTKDIAIIFVTAINKEEQYVVKGFTEGAVDYLQKPLDINVTRAKVNVFEKLHFYQQELKNSLSQVERVNKQLENFVHIVSHDLKSPLASVITILSTLKRNEVVEANEDLHWKIDMVTMASSHLADMIESILTYSKQSLEEQALEEVNTYELVQQVVFLLFPPDNVTINVSEDLPILNTRKPKLQQVFQNLLSNAIKYGKKEKIFIEVGVNKKVDFYEFWVRDNGPGIAKEDEQRIFSLFTVAGNESNKDSSTGVGLNILKVIIEEQGGKIWVESQPGSGSTFFFLWRDN